MNGLDCIVDRDPAHPLIPGAEPRTETQTEGQQHFSQRATGRAEHDPEPGVDHSNALDPSRLRRFFPFLGYRDEEVPVGIARRALFGEHLVTAVPVDPHRRG